MIKIKIQLLFVNLGVLLYEIKLFGTRIRESTLESTYKDNAKSLETLLFENNENSIRLRILLVS